MDLNKQKRGTHNFICYFRTTVFTKVQEDVVSETLLKPQEK